ncbi:ABC transporter ATP-binding protein [Desulfopila sp. IMCC35008]|uniref:ABC transporter ATP-binding protein n=1 Tax=Desulfopila sp. IMCC35008 TaxID=2653858 RepID=UPI0013D4BCF6|nr:ABC transporter ATP-binding protein [Desulfopila sp. IMCC35008]
MKEEILKATDLTREYRIGNTMERIVDDVSLSVAKGEFVVISGKSGSGKTTLLSLLSGLERPTEGRVFIGGRDITDLSEDDLGVIRNRSTGFVFQSFHLIPSLSALENIMFPADLKGDRDGRAKGEKLLRKVDLWERRSHFPDQLSGGEKQRVAICRALINEPDIIFADEPTGNLDSENSKIVIDLLTELYREQTTSLVMATHSKEIAAMADRILYLHDGRLQREQDGGA